MLQIGLGLVWVCTTGRQEYSVKLGCALQTTYNRTLMSRLPHLSETIRGDQCTTAAPVNKANVITKET